MSNASNSAKSSPHFLDRKPSDGTASLLSLFVDLPAPEQLTALLLLSGTFAGFCDRSKAHKLLSFTNEDLAEIGLTFTHLLSTLGFIPPTLKPVGSANEGSPT